MRIAYISTLDRLELGREQATLKRFAERSRTIFFNLASIGESSNADIIERVVRKLHPTDRLEWNARRGTGLERRTLVEFGDWLCIRAESY